MSIRAELGEEAVILKTNRVGGALFSKGEVEVTAGVDEDKAPAPKTAQFSPIQLDRVGVYSHPQHRNKPTRAVIEPVKPDALVGRVAAARSASGQQPSTDILALKEDIKELKALVRATMASAPAPVQPADAGFDGGWAILYRRLLDAEVKPEVARRLVSDVRAKYNPADSDSAIDGAVLDALSRSFPAAPEPVLKMDGPLLAVFVGPTGSGKTTTLAKLAAHHVLVKQRAVSIITADTYRIAAIEQIRTFADIVGVGLQVVFSPEEVAEAREACENDDIVFVDTAGRSQRNAEHMDDLKRILDALMPDEIHLVLSATTKDSDLHDQVARYRTMGVNRLIFTKLDETVRLGNILNVVSSSGVPVSYFTTGQSVPDDIERALASRFLQRLWKEGA